MQCYRQPVATASIKALRGWPRYFVTVAGQGESGRVSDAAMPHLQKPKETADWRSLRNVSRVQRSAEDGVEQVAELAQAVAAAGALATATACAAASVVAGLATDSDTELFVIAKVVVHGRLLLLDEGGSASLWSGSTMSISDGRHAVKRQSDVIYLTRAPEAG